MRVLNPAPHANVVSRNFRVGVPSLGNGVSFDTPKVPLVETLDGALFQGIMPTSHKKKRLTATDRLMSGRQSRVCFQTELV